MRHLPQASTQYRNTNCFHKLSIESKAIPANASVIEDASYGQICANHPCSIFSTKEVLWFVLAILVFDGGPFETYAHLVGSFAKDGSMSNNSPDSSNTVDGPLIDVVQVCLHTQNPWSCLFTQNPL